MSKMTTKEKMLAALSKTDGYNTFTTAQARARFGVKNVSARINELREDGHAIYTNSKMHNGRKVTFYRLGTPTKRMVAEGIKALRSQGVSTFA